MSLFKKKERKEERERGGEKWTNRLAGWASADIFKF
jgi:hypothetical protein